MSDSVRWSAHIVTDDATASLPDALHALEAADPPPSSVIVVDNGPAGGFRPEGQWSNVRRLRNPRPKSHGRCHNQAVELAMHALQDSQAGMSGAIALMLTRDVIIGDNMLSKLQRLFEADPHIACVGPVICRAHVIGSLDGERRELDVTDVIDSAGISLGLLGRVKPIARGLTQKDAQSTREPFSPSPACFAVRLSALNVMSRTGPWFHESGSWEGAAIGLFRGLKASGFTLAIAKDAFAWRLAARGPAPYGAGRGPAPYGAGRG